MTRSWAVQGGCARAPSEGVQGWVRTRPQGPHQRAPVLVAKCFLRHVSEGTLGGSPSWPTLGEQGRSPLFIGVPGGYVGEGPLGLRELPAQ